jgi:hypothetical protein
VRTAVAALVLLCGMAHAHGAPRLAHYDLDVTVDSRARTVRGTARVTVENATAAPLDELVFWLYANRFGARSPALNDYNFHWVYPGGFDAGSMRAQPGAVEDHAVAGARTLLRVKLPAPLAPGARTEVALDFDVRVPERFGRFGCFRKTCVLGGGFYPMLAAFGGGGGGDGAWDLSAPPARATYRVTVRAPRVADAIVNGQLRAVPSGGAITVDVGEAEAAALVIGPPRLRTIAIDHRGVHVELYTAAGRPLPSPRGAIVPYLLPDRSVRMLHTVREALDMLAEMGTPIAPGTTLHLYEGALRVELARALPGFVLVSDQAFAILPVERFLKFHEFELARALFTQLAAERIAAHERADDAGLAPEVAAAALVDRYTVRAYARAEWARDILKWASFIPAIDRILYAPQVPFASAYFYTLEDSDPMRDALAQFANGRPQGKRIYAKLRDLVGDAGIADVVRRQLAGQPLREAAEAVRGATLDWFFAQWLGPYPFVDYRFVDVRSTPREGGGWRHVAIVEKRGDAPPVEPVEVRARDKRGHVATQTWDGLGARHEYVFDMEAPLRAIEIDPRGRLVEELPGSNDDLRFDDRRPARWKFIYNNFGALVNVTPSFSLDLRLDFSLARILDVKHSFGFVLFNTQSTDFGLTANYARQFGRKVTAARLTQGLGASLTVARLNSSFARAVGEGMNPGTTVSASVGYGYDDRLFFWEPWRALSFGASVGGAVTVLDSGVALPRGTVSASAELIRPLRDDMQLAAYVIAGVTFGDLRIPTQMLGTGGAGGLRGYATDEMLGRARVLARVEWRHTFVHSLDWNFLQAVYLRGIGGGLFVEGAVVSDCESYAMGTRSFAADVGYSLRLFGDWLGVSQTTFNLDVGVPLLHPARTCFSKTPIEVGRRAPVGFFFAFAAPW